MSVSDVKRAAAFVACVPHVPLLAMQARDVNPGLWEAYEQRVAEFKAFDPDLVVVFGGDHYDGVHLKMMPTFAIGHLASGLADCGGHPGLLDVPLAIAQACSRAVVNDGFDIATSYALEVDHGFTNVMHNFMGELNARPVLPVLINAIADPKPTFKRCRQFGEAIGRFAATLDKRVAFLGSGGLSHQTDFIFPQYNTAPNTAVRDFIVHGGMLGDISRDKWMGDIQQGMDGLSADLISDKFKAPWINKAWDEQFMATFAAGDLTAFDGWDCEEVTRVAGYGGGEIRQWIAAAAAAQAMGVRRLHADYYSDQSKLAVGVGVAHGSTEA
jgi:2,3-dihydroxyphenylpropionate 1,2-dioxygenase